MRTSFIAVAALFAFAGTAQAAVNINTATQAELETLHGINAAKANASRAVRRIYDIARVGYVIIVQAAGAELVGRIDRAANENIVSRSRAASD